MKKKFLPTLLAGAAAVAGGLISSPSGQQLAEQAVNANTPQVTQQAPQRYVNNAQQQAQARTPGQTVQQYLSNPYAPYGGGGAYYGHGYGMSPKDYGEYLMRTGKDKQNLRKRKHWAKMRS